MPVSSLLNPQVKELLNKAISSELYASQLYRYLAVQMQRMGLFGMQKFFEDESLDEIKHYEILRNYINDMGDMASTPKVSAVDDSVGGIGSALNIAYEAEKALLYEYVDTYEKVEDDMEDCITAQFLLQFIERQRKSVGEYGDLIARFEKNPQDVFMFDDYVGKLG